MADKLTLADIDFDAIDASDEARELREEQLRKEKHAAARVKAIAEDFKSRNEPLSDTDLRSLKSAAFTEAVTGKPFDWSPSGQKGTANFENVEGAADTVAPTYWDERKEDLTQLQTEATGLGKQGVSSIESALSGALVYSADNPYGTDLMRITNPVLAGVSAAAEAILPGPSKEANILQSERTGQASMISATRPRASETAAEARTAPTKANIIEGMRNTYSDYISGLTRTTEV